MKAKEVMTKDVISVNENTTVKEVVEILMKNKISGVPVVDEENKVVGIVSETDLMFREQELNVPAFVPLFEGFILLDSVKKFEKQLRKKVAYKVKDIMTTPVIKVGKEDDVEDVIDIMLEKNINRVPVVDEEGVLVGIIARGDILKKY